MIPQQLRLVVELLGHLGAVFFSLPFLVVFVAMSGHDRPGDGLVRGAIDRRREKFGKALAELLDPKELDNGKGS